MSLVYIQSTPYWGLGLIKTHFSVAPGGISGPSVTYYILRIVTWPSAMALSTVYPPTDATASPAVE